MPDTCGINEVSNPCFVLAMMENWPWRRLERDNFEKFRAMGAQKPRMVLQLMSSLPIRGVVLSDVDVVWLRRPHAFFDAYPSADVMISTDCLSLKASPFLGSMISKHIA